jgi:type VI secretion system protein ImpK
MFGSGRPPAGRAGRDRPRPSGRRDALETVVLEPTPSRGRARATSSTRETAEPSSARLVDLAADWLAMIVAVRHATSSPDPQAVRSRALEHKGRLEARARDAGFSASDIEAAVYGLVAFLDESVLRTPGPGRDAWMQRSLQMELYGSNIAGEEFFTRLERLRKERETRIEALEVYYCVLAFGFMGRYGLSGPEKLASLLAEVESDIGAVRGGGRGALAPHATRRETGAAAVTGGLPLWLVLVVFVPALALVWIVIRMVAFLHAGGAADAIRKLMGS